MADKTVVFYSQQLAGRNDLVLYLINMEEGTVGNTGGTSVTPGSNGKFSCVINQPITGVWLVIVKDTNDVPLLENGYVQFKLDVVGTYRVESSPFFFDIDEQLQDIAVAVSSPTNSDKVLVDENYGGANRLTYMLRGRPVSDATIEVYLYSDYVLGRFNDAYRLDRTRQRIDGTWEKAFYLDPGQYAIRFNKSGVAGPDDYYVVVSFEESEIRIQKI